VVERLTGRGWAAAVYPAGGDPSPQRTRNGCARQAAAQAVPDAKQTTQGKAHTPGRWTRCTLCTRYQTGRAGQIGAAAGLEGVQLLYHAYYDSSIAGMVY